VARPIGKEKKRKRRFPRPEIEAGEEERGEKSFSPTLTLRGGKKKRRSAEKRKKKRKKGAWVAGPREPTGKTLTLKKKKKKEGKTRSLLN